MSTIDPDFTTKRQIVEQHEGHDVFGPIEKPDLLGIHGHVVAVDFDICIADGICLDVCPINVFEWINTPRTNPHRLYPDLPPLHSERKADPIREHDCIFCLACEVQCPVHAIKITRPPDI